MGKFKNKKNDYTKLLKILHDLQTSYVHYFASSICGGGITKRKCYNQFKKFMLAWITYARPKFASELSFDTVAPKVFLLEKDISKSANKEKEFWRNSLYVSMKYMEKLSSQDEIDIKTFNNCEDLIGTILADYSKLLAKYEETNHSNKVIVNCFRNEDSNLFKLKKTANEIFYLHGHTKIKDISFRDIRPLTIFIIRQALEIAGKGIIGYKKIINPTTNCEVPKFSQESWKFLAGIEKKNLVTLPISAVTIHKLATWTNSYIHTSNIPPIYLQFYANELLWGFASPRKKLKTPIFTTDFTIGDFVINDYVSLKKEFESHINNNSTMQYQIEWLSNPKAYKIK